MFNFNRLGRHRAAGFFLTLGLALACAAAGDRADRPATRPAEPATQPATKSFRAIFKPGKRSPQKTSWSGLARMGARDSRLMALVTAYLGDRFPVTLAGSNQPLFWGEMIAGDDDRIDLRITRPDGTKQVIELVRDKAVDVEVGERTFQLSYGSTHVAAAEQPVWEKVTIIVTHRPKQQ